MAGNSGNWGVETSVEGLADIRLLLRGFAPEVSKVLNRELSTAATIVATRARSLTPASTGTARAAIEVRRGGDFRSRAGFRVVQKDAGGAIIEWAGNKSDGGTAQSQSTIRTLRSRYGPAPRFLWRAWEETKDQVLREVGTAIAKAEDELQSRLDAGATSTVKVRQRKPKAG